MISYVIKKPTGADFTYFALFVQVVEEKVVTVSRGP